jgi:hypothetical protein
MRPIGYQYKRVAAAPEFLGAQVTDVYSLSSHISEDFADYINLWRHNGYWLFDSPAALQALAAAESISLQGLQLFYYEAHELQYDDGQGRWLDFAPDPSFETHIQPPAAATLEGLDVVTFCAGNAPECSPLSCNGLARSIGVNSHCLLPSLSAAIQALEQGWFKNSEPGPFRIIAVHSIADPPGA